MNSRDDSDATGIQISQVGWREVETQLATGATAILPVGAACKENGEHLPMNTDLLQAEWLGIMIAQSFNVAVWPTLGYGYFPAFVDYPGSVSLSEQTFRLAVGDILAGITAAGAQHMVVLNTGISTIKPLQEAIAASQQPVKLVNVYSGRLFEATVAQLQEQQWGGHADEIETSIMLALAPDLVRMELAQPGLQPITGGRFNRTDPTAPNYSPSGVNGDPTLASRDKGARLMQAMLADVCKALSER